MTHPLLVRASMKALYPSALLVGTAFLAVAWPARAQSTVTISMTAPPATPRLQGPFTVGGKPATPFLFAIPATGQAPLTFAVTGLPSGLTLAASTGIISGPTPAAGSYPLAVTVTSSAGSAGATYTLVSGGSLALTPPLGWNSYDSFGASVTEQDMLDEAQAVRTSLQPFGWNYVVVDYRWYEPGEPLDENGRYLPATSKYPSATGSTGFKSLSDKIHALGLGFGIHIMRGVPRKAYDASLPIAGSTHTTHDAGNASDPCPWDTHMWGVRGDTAAGKAWYDALFQQFAAWGVDYVKIDDMLNNSTKTYHQAEVDAIHAAIDKSGRAIVLSLSPGPDDPSWLPNSAPHLDANANLWRVVNDFWDFNALTDLPGVFKSAAAWQGVSGLTPGHWADLDMLPLGYLGPRNEWHTSGQTTFTKNEQVTILSLWSMLPSPLMFGGNPARLGSDAWTLALLTNEEVLAVNQDALGARGRRSTTTGGELWVRDLSGGRKAVGFFNRGTADAQMSASFSDLGITGTPTIRDLWQRSDVTGMTTALSANVPGGAALLYTVSPPSATGGAGGMGGTGNAGATGAAGTSGGASGTAGATGGGVGGEVAGVGGGVSPSAGTGAGGKSSGGATAAGSAGRGNGASGSPGAAAAGKGGAPASGGNASAGVSATGTAGHGAPGAGNGTGSSGCGCTVPARTPRTRFALLLAAAALGTLRRRRSRSRSIQDAALDGHVAGRVTPAGFAPATREIAKSRDPQ